VNSMSVSPEEITVAIIDDHEAIRLGFAGACLEHGFKLLAHGDSVANLIGKLKEKPQVVVLDLSLADGSNPASNVRELIDYGTEVLIFSIADKKTQVSQALKEGAAALVTKSQQMKEKEHIDRVRQKYADVGRPAQDKSELLIRLIEDGLYGEDLI